MVHYLDRARRYGDGVPIRQPAPAEFKRVRPLSSGSAPCTPRSHRRQTDIRLEESCPIHHSHRTPRNTERALQLVVLIQGYCISVCTITRYDALREDRSRSHPRSRSLNGLESLDESRIPHPARIVTRQLDAEWGSCLSSCAIPDTIHRVTTSPRDPVILPVVRRSTPKRPMLQSKKMAFIGRMFLSSNSSRNPSAAAPADP